MPIKQDEREDVSTKRVLMGSVILVLLIRLIAWLNTAIVSRDSIIYVALARDWLTGSYLKALHHPYHPLYPFLIAGVSKVSGLSLEHSAVGLSIAVSALTIPALAISYNEYGSSRRILFLALLFFAVSPFLVRYSADVLTEPLYLFFVAWAAALFFKAVSGWEKRPGWIFLAGISVGFAYLTRPEGLVVGIAAVIWLLTFYRDIPTRQILLWALALILGGIVVGSPYILYLHKDTGGWILTRKKRIGTLISEASGKGETVQQVPLPRDLKNLPKGISKKRAEFLRNRKIWQWEQADRIRQALGEPTKPRIKPNTSTWQFLLVFLVSLGNVLVGFVKGMFFPIGIWVVFRFFSLKRYPWNRVDRFILIFTILYWVMLGLLLSGYGYVSRRHYAAVGMFWFGWAAVGFVWACHSLARAFKRHVTAKVIGACLLILILGFSVFKATKPFRREKIGRKVVGAWILKQKPKGKKCVVLTSMVRIGYYAGCRAIFLQVIGERDVNALRRHEIAYVILQKEEMKKSPVLMTLLKKFGYSEVYHYTNPVGHQDLHVFSFRNLG